MAAPMERDTELCRRKKIEEKLVKLYSDIDEGFQNQGPRADEALDYWDMYNTQLGPNQYYNGTSKIYVPIVHNAVNARATRFVNQLFPRGGRYVDVVSTDGEEPHAISALLEHYVRKAKLRTEVAYPLCVAGDIEGQYNAYVEWSSKARHVSWKETKPTKVAQAELPKELVEGVEEMVDDVILDEHPIVEVLPDADVLILPATCNSVEEALAIGGSVSIIRRWSKGQLKQLIADGDIDEERAEGLLKEMAKAEKPGQKDMPKAHADAAGIKDKGKTCLAYETWTRLKIGDKLRLCRIFYGGDKLILSCKLNPNWSDRCPLISVAVKKVGGVVKGISQIQPCAQMQYAANDAVNEGMDSAAYALLPIIMTDPLKNPKTSTMILDLAAVWECSPNDTKFATFPELWKGAFEIVAACQQQIFQTLSVNPAMLPQSTGGKTKRNQAEIATEQQVDILTTADAVTVLEEGVFTPILMRFAELDAQHRETALTIRQFGHLGIRAKMEEVPPLQLGNRYTFVWFGVEQARSAAQLQQQISLINVVKSLPPQMLPGRRLNMVPAVEHAMAATFGPRIAPLVFEDVTKLHTYPPEAENEILGEGHLWPISPQDDHAKHIEIHIEAVKASGDPHGTLKQHIAYHRLAQVQQALAQQQQAQGQPPGGPASPRPGGQVAKPNNGKGPPGMIAPERMPAAGAISMPRKY